MKIFTDADKPRFPYGTVLTIGAYDGVHLGHRHLIAETIESARSLGAESVVVTFDRHPASIVRPETTPLLLSDLDQKLECLEQTGVDVVYIITFDEARANESAVDFIEEFLVGRLSVKKVVVGKDFHFGHNRQGNVELLSQFGKKHGFEVFGAPLWSLGGKDETVISSTRIRQLIAAGEMESAASLLGRLYELRGEVEHGDSRGGSELGYPTANVSFSQEMATPPDGIYAGWLVLTNGEKLPSAISLGTRPTFYPRGGQRLLEAFVIDFYDDLYGKEVRIRFGKKIRDQERFSSSEELIKEISHDIDKVRAFCSAYSW